jgi:hypothetical protein
MLTQFSAEANSVSCPIPHFASFDHRFIKLSEAFSLDSVIYAADGSRFEPFFPSAVVLRIYELRERSCQEFFSDASKRDRQHRAWKGDTLYEQLGEAEAVLVQELKEVMR